MSTENEVIDKWRERRDLILAVKERLDDQFGALTNAVVAEAGPTADEEQRIEDLQFELGQLEEAYLDAEHKYLTYSQGSDPMKPSEKGEQDNG